MNLRRRYRELVLAGALVAGALLAVATGGRVDLFDGVLYDIAVAIAPLRASPATSNVVVVAIDERSLSSKSLESTPRVFFSPFYAEMLNGLFQGGAKAVGFDIIFSYAASRFHAIERDYDDPLLSALAANRQRVVLARTATTTIAEPIVAAVFDPESDGGREEPRAVAYSELVPSEDGVQRWVYSQFTTSDGTQLPTLAARLAEIAGAQAHPEPFLLAPAARLESLPTYAFSDVLSCIRSNPEAVKAAFDGKVVLIGSNLAEEDRKRAPDRFLRQALPPAKAGANGRCGLQPLGPSAPDSDTVPGMHIHAAAVDALIAGTGVMVAPYLLRIVASTGAAVICASIGLFLAPGVALGALVCFLALVFAASVASVASGHWLPVAIPMIASLCALVGGQLTRFFAEDRRRRRLERAFGCYLAPAIVSKLADSDGDLKLGGEERVITVMFADLTNFTGISDTMGPAELMELANQYFKAIVDVIDQSGGYVDKFIGDSVMAIWGAPAHEADAPGKALASGLLIQQRVRELTTIISAGGRPTFGVKVGISSGPAIVGNIGTPRRLSYTALGATVNLAARLEQACGTFGCGIVVDAATRNSLRERYLFCELDAVSLKGKRDPLSVYEAIAAIETATAEQRAYVAQYQLALESYRNGNPAKAAALWSELVDSARDGDAVSAPGVMAQRARMSASTSAAWPMHTPGSE